MPFANYDDFEACVRAHSDKDDPEAYCATIKRQVEGQAEEFDDLDLGRLLQAADAHPEEMLAEILQAAIVEQELPDECRSCGAPSRMEGSMVCADCADEDAPHQQAVIIGLSQEALDAIGERYNVDVEVVDGEGSAAPTDSQSQSE